MRNVLLLVGGGVMVFLGLIAIIANSLYDNHKFEQPLVTDPCDTTSFSYLLALQEGKKLEAALLWKPGLKPRKLFAVHSFNEITHGRFSKANGQPYKPERTYYQYEVESSTLGFSDPEKVERCNGARHSDNRQRTILQRCGFARSRLDQQPLESINVDQ